MLTVSLTREFRFYFQQGRLGTKTGNAWGGHAVSHEIAPYLCLRATVRGPVDPQTGYLLNIQTLDQALADFLARGNTAEPPWTHYLQIIDQASRLQSMLPSSVQVQHLELIVSPQLSFHASGESLMIKSLTQEFEFSAAHRLNCSTLSPAENMALFSKCNNPAGHGHNYRVNVTVNIASDPFDFVDFERTLKEVIIDHLDHKHLNADVAEFRDLNPSVENIAWVIWQRLKGTKWGPHLQNVRVFETPKTWADYSESGQ